MKALEIPDEPILNDLADYQGQWTMVFGTEFHTWLKAESIDLVIRTIVSPSVSASVLLAKLNQLCKRRLIEGCPCGCPGAFEITDEGLKAIGRARTTPLSDRALLASHNISFVNNPIKNE